LNWCRPCRDLFLNLYFKLETECLLLIELCEEVGTDNLKPLSKHFSQIDAIISKLNENNLHLENVTNLFILPREVQKLNHELGKILREIEAQLEEKKIQDVKKLFF
jgi:hypothetical protein